MGQVRDTLKYERVDPNSEMAATLDNVREQFSQLGDWVEENYSPNRHRAIALTHIEEACRAVITGILKGNR